MPESPTLDDLVSLLEANWTRMHRPGGICHGTAGIPNNLCGDSTDGHTLTKEIPSELHEAFQVRGRNGGVLIGSEQPRGFSEMCSLESIVESASNTYVEGVTSDLNSRDFDEAVQEVVVGAGTPIIGDKYWCHACKIVNQCSGRGIGTESRDHTDHVVSHSVTIARDGLVLRG